MIYIKLNKKDQYIFTSERLGFRNWNHMDLEELVELNSDEMVMEHFPKTLTENEVGELIKSLKKHFALNGFTYYATEGAKRCLEFAFNELALNKIISVCTIQNRKSENVMRKIGMKKIGEFNHPNMIHHPDYEKHLCYEISKNPKNLN